LTCQKQVAKLESARSNNDEDEDNGEINKREARHIAINLQFILGCQESGLGPGDADIVCSAMNMLPLAVQFWSKQGNFAAVKEKVGEAEVATTALAMEDREAIYQTLNGLTKYTQDFQWWWNNLRTKYAASHR
jgi:hypothetical protein